MDEHDRAQGCLMGLFVGDAAGATLEFLTGELGRELVDKAMHMPGGGRLGVAPGQFTDDSELAIQLLNALATHDPMNGLPKDAIAKNYIEWHRSNPFDMGHTCARAFGFANNAKEMMDNAQKYNTMSEANGSLMRLAPLVIWSRHLPQQTIMQMVREEALLSHCNEVCQDANALYAVIVSELLNGSGASSALESATRVKSTLHPTVQDWMRPQELKQLDCTRGVGHVKHAIQLLLYTLRHELGFEDGLRCVLMKGGDTDTNAAIVGSALGALYGFRAIPVWMRDPVLNRVKHVKQDNKGYQRPTIYDAKLAMQIIDTLCSK